MYMRTLSGLASATLLLVSPAFAADLATRAPAYATPPAPVYNWSGFYAGGNLGGAWGYSEASTTTVFDPNPTGYFKPTSPAAIASSGDQDITPTGFTGGGQVGYNRQFGWLVVGAEMDINYLGLKGSSSDGAVYPCCMPHSFTVNSSISTDWLFTARPRVGWALNNWLIYITGGLAVGDLKGKFSFTDTFGATESGSISATKTGWTFGGGIEVGVRGPWTVKVEYLLVDLGSASTTSTNLNVPMYGGAFPTNPFTHGVDLTASIVRAGLNYRF
jgi:outer membrane immunogenic protein